MLKENQALSNDNLPIWDLTDLYPGRESNEVKNAISDLSSRAAKFKQDYAEKIKDLESDDFAKSIQEYETIQEELGRLGSFAYLEYAGDMNDQEIVQFFQKIQETLTTISSDLIFFTLEINNMDEDALNEKLKHDVVKKYRPWLRDIRVFKPHQLNQDLEKLFLEKSLTGERAWTRLFDETINRLTFNIQNKTMTSTEALDCLSSTNGDLRKEAALEIGRVFGEEKQIFTFITNTLAKDKEIEDQWRKYSKPVSSRNLSNFIEDDVVEALVNSVRENYKSLSHRYYRLKAKWFGVEKMNYWDRNAPLPNDFDEATPWEKAKDIVYNAYADFSPVIADIGKKFFDNNWIDVPARPGKAPGAFAHPTVPSAHPYLLLNYQGKVRDVMTLAHELGHGVHQFLSREQGYLMADTPLTLAETASVFGEMLTFQSLLKSQNDPKARKIMLANKVEDMLNTAVRQVAFHFFEEKIHNARRQGELSASDIGKIWMDVQNESLGGAFIFGDEYQYYWSYIPHFIHSPFYVYAYAFGECLVNSLYAKYESCKTENEKQDFSEKYISMLKAGGIMHHKELLAPFGLNAADPDFWKKGLNVISGFIDELESIE